MSLKMPKLLGDLYRDLRDRHLLLPAIALAVGLIAVPLLLSKGPAPAAPPPPASAEGTAATVPAVLADSEVSVRDYRRRLDELTSKNPFEQQFEPRPDDTAAGGGISPGGTSPTAADGTPGLTTSLPSSSSPATSGTTGGTTDNTSGDSSQNDADVVNQLVVRRVDVMVGVQGDLKQRNGVRPMTVLPSEATPVLAFLGTDDAGKRAAFVVSSDVTSVGGDGACVPSPGCLFITLEKGESATLDYGPDGQTYELELERIRDVKLKTG
jgi:hypothetical protein